MKDRFIFIAAALESIELIQSYTDAYDLTRRDGVCTLVAMFGYPRKVGQFKIKPFVAILSATHCSQYKILELDLTGL
jgi:hypothetical protein